MSRNKRQIQLGGGVVKTGTLIGVLKSSENWNEYVLEDGTVLKLKPVVTEVLRVDGEYAPDGNPLYVIRASNVVAADAPEELRKPV